MRRVNGRLKSDTLDPQTEEISPHLLHADTVEQNVDSYGGPISDSRGGPPRGSASRPRTDRA